LENRELKGWGEQSTVGDGKWVGKNEVPPITGGGGGGPENNGPLKYHPSEKSTGGRQYCNQNNPTPGNISLPKKKKKTNSFKAHGGMYQTETRRKSLTWGRNPRQKIFIGRNWGSGKSREVISKEKQYYDIMFIKGRNNGGGSSCWGKRKFRGEEMDNLDGT